MRRPLAALIAISSTAVVVATVGVSPTEASASTTHALISGSGSTWPSNAINQWIADVQPKGEQVDYTPNGQGKADFAQRTTDFGVTDVPYLGLDPVTGNEDSSDGRAYANVPIVAGATTFPYQLRVHGKSVTNLRLSGKTITKIFTNQITNWDDPQITKNNNGHRLPSLPIIPVVHSEGSGVTYNVTSYFAAEYPKIWKSFNGGEAAATQYYPRAGDQIVENGSAGVINFIRSSSANGAIGMDEYTYALGGSVPVAAVKNAAKYYVTPTADNVGIALEKASIDQDPTSATYGQPDLTPVFESTDKRAYPFSTFATMLIPTSPTDPRMITAKRQTINDFAHYGMCNGQGEVQQLGFAPLTLNLVRAGFTALKQLQAADPAVDVSKDAASMCHNPTYKKANPTKKYLKKIAPKPPKCAKSGEGPCPSSSTSPPARRDR